MVSCPIARRYLNTLRVNPFAIPNFRAFFAARVAANVASAMLVIVIGWQVYDIARLTMSTKDAAFLLGMIGLAQFLPLFALTLVVGYVADRVDRRYIARAATALVLFCAALLGGLALAHNVTLTALFVVAVLLGVGRAFIGPALSALAPNLVPREMLPTAIAWNSIGWQGGGVVGPPLGAFLYAASPAAPYLLATVLFAIALVALFMITPVPRPARSLLSPWRATLEGLGYVRHNQIVLGAISLDLFAVLLGGATAMLPVYARDVLHVGVAGLGPLRAAPAAGAAITALLLTRLPITRHVGVKMFACVALFGISTIVFGLSKDLYLSLGALAVLGAADMISVYVRSSLIQLHTPDAMRGRVSAVSSVFISASNELGEFESGLTAAWLGPVEAVVAGGVGAVAVTLIWAWQFPALRRADRFVAPETSSPAAIEIAIETEQAETAR
ncbi:MFS transporter [Polymorphobacter megasporae]|uniref:MFS transporter n=1 Tax=Glacieibacterium megasporae TaxID=2835787 RepID=UPI001C1E146D|nr:MFS transporter [Polymorphobacter megasporae]UAJ10061.1 MFS transporter [Polymorphobacter megasporae]